jgi:uncharacterized caspase-like protein
MAKYALLIGVSEYEPGLNLLPGATKDVEAMQRVLQHPEIGGFETEDIIVLKNQQRQEAEEAIFTFFANKRKEDLLLLYFLVTALLMITASFTFQLVQLANTKAN